MMYGMACMFDSDAKGKLRVRTIFSTNQLVCIVMEVTISINLSLPKNIFCISTKIRDQMLFIVLLKSSKKHRSNSNKGEGLNVNAIFHETKQNLSFILVY
ncbi:hypothetical protein V6Z11_D11G140800 [Gossypium hirsutum]